MRKTKEICRLAGAGLSARAIGRVLGASNSTVSDTISRLKAAGLTWADAEVMPEADLQRRLYREKGHIASDPRQPDWAYTTPLGGARDRFCDAQGHVLSR